MIISMKNLKQAGCVTFADQRERKIVRRAEHSDLHLIETPHKIIAVSSDELEVMISDRFRREATAAIEESKIHIMTERHLDSADRTLTRASERLAISGAPDTLRSR